MRPSTKADIWTAVLCIFFAGVIWLLTQLILPWQFAAIVGMFAGLLLFPALNKWLLEQSAAAKIMDDQ